MDLASVMMVSYNRLPLTQRMMNSFFTTTTSPYRLIIVDNGSTDGTVEWLQELNNNWTQHTNCRSLDILYNPQNKGIAAGRNQGLKIADKYGDPYLSTLDNDVELPTNWLQDCIDIIKAGQQKYMIGVNMEGVSYPLKTIGGKTFQYKERGNLGTAAMVFPRQLHHDIGFFHSFGHLYSSEDADAGMRARCAGYEMGYLKENGVHFGEGPAEDKEYREWKTACHAETLLPFQQRCRDYMAKRVSIFVPYSE